MNRRSFIKSAAILGAGISVPLMGRAKTAIPETPEELFTAINRLFENMGEYNTAYTPIHGPIANRVVFETYANGWLKPEGEPAKGSFNDTPTRAIRHMWHLALHKYEQGNRKVWWRRRPVVDADNDWPGNRQRLWMRLQFT